MAQIPTTPWHRTSFEALLQERLPQLLAERLPVVDCKAEEMAEYTCRIQVRFKVNGSEVEVAYEDLPRPDRDGVFHIDGRDCVVLPEAPPENLETAEIRCVGELFYDFVAARLQCNGEEGPEDEETARAWLPLDQWFGTFMQERAVELDQINWLARQTHLRRLHNPERGQVVAPEYLGHICPIETAEGPNLGRYITIARGAEIRDGQLAVVDDRPAAHLGLSASSIPFFENSDPARLLMGANMMRQWLPSAAPEPALVQSGMEPDEPAFWCGYNLLTAYVPWGADTFEDGLVISASCAARLQYAQPLEPGDKLSNRHGTKGVISRVLPDVEMPHMPDGAPVDIVCDFMSLPTRMNFGQVREAVMSRIARAQGETALVPPFEAPQEEELRALLKKVGLPEDGMEQLNYQGRELAHRSTVGWVYWGCTFHLAREKIMATVDEGRGQRQSDAEFFALRQAGAYETIREHYNTRSIHRRDAGELAERVAQGPVEQAAAPAPGCAAVMCRLAAAGIAMELRDEKLVFSLATPQGDVLELAAPVAHPWLGGHKVGKVGAVAEVAEYADLVEANERLQRALAGRAPSSLKEKAERQLQERAAAFFEALLTPTDLRFGANMLFSGRAVLAPGVDLRYDQIGLPEEIAWTLFGPLLRRQVDAAEVEKRSVAATQKLDEIMAQAWVIFTHAPVLMTTGLLAFHPVRIADRAIRIHPLTCFLVNGDFDGDQAAVFLPITAAGQREAGEKLSIAGHIECDPGLIYSGLWRTKLDAQWGLSRLSLAAEGQKEIDELVGMEVGRDGGMITAETVAAALAQIAQRRGSAAVLETCDRLLQRGFAAAKETGASVNPFLGSALEKPPKPEGKDDDAWDAYAEEIMALLAAYEDLTDDDLGPLCLIGRSRSRNPYLWPHLAKTVGVLRPRNGGPGHHALCEGLVPEESFAIAGNVWRALYRMQVDSSETGRQIRGSNEPTGFNVLARAKRARRPGVVFARAAANGEVDELADEYSRLFVGLPVGDGR